MENVARLAEAGGGRGLARRGVAGRRAWQGWGGVGGAAARVGPGSGYVGTCRSPGNVGIVSEELQTFRSKERARREFVGKE